MYFQDGYVHFRFTNETVPHGRVRAPPLLRDLQVPGLQSRVGRPRQDQQQSEGPSAKLRTRYDLSSKSPSNSVVIDI